jgi:hypothetical protein
MIFCEEKKGASRCVCREIKLHRINFLKQCKKSLLPVLRELQVVGKLAKKEENDMRKKVIRCLDE